MHDRLAEIWSQSTDYYLAHLTDSERLQLHAVASQEELLEFTHSLEQKYSQHTTARCLRRTQTLVAQLRSFSAIINIFTQSNPEIASLVWGPLAFILELAARHQDTLDLITDVFERIERVLPRFQEYLKEFGPRASSGRLQDALVVYYAELIAHYQDTIIFLRVHPLKNLLLFHRPAIRFNSQANKRLFTLREKTVCVEEEVGWTKYQVQQSQHRQLMQLLASKAQVAMVSKLPYRGLPYPRNHQFRFRDHILSELDAYFQPGLPASGLRVASLYGLGGVGKTQLTLEFAYKHSDDYDAIFWVKTETEAKLRDSLCTYARALQEGDEPVPQQDNVLISAFMKWLMTSTVLINRSDVAALGSTPDGKLTEPLHRSVRWLVIYDNLEDERMCREFWPLGSHGSIIITTRDPEISHALSSRSFQVPLFTTKESSSYMLAVNPSSDGTNDGEKAATSAIADRLGHLPLALSHIGSLVRSTALSYEVFMKRHADFDTNILFRGMTGDGPYEKALSTTWTAVLEGSANAKALLHVLTLFEPDGVPIEIIECRDAKAKLWNGPSDEFPRLEECLQALFPDKVATDQAIAALLRSSLVNRTIDGDYLSFHRIVKEAVLQSMTHEELVLYFYWALFSLNGCFPVDAKGAPMLEAWDRYLQERGNFKAATDMIQKGCDILEIASRTENHPGYYPRYLRRSMSDLYNTLGCIEYELNVPGHGRHWFQRSDTHRRKLVDIGNADTLDFEMLAVVMSNSALADLADGDEADSSIANFHLLIDEYNSTSSRHIAAASLSIAYRIKENLEESLKWCRAAFNWTVESSGKDSLSMALVQFNTGNTLLAMKKDQEALEAFENCLRIRQERAPTHAYTGLVCHKIGDVMRARGDLERASAFFRSATNILKDCESYGGAAARSKYALAGTLEEMGEFEEAESLYADIREIMGKLDRHVEWSSLASDFFEQFVLFCHR